MYQQCLNRIISSAVLHVAVVWQREKPNHKVAVRSSCSMLWVGGGGGYLTFLSRSLYCRAFQGISPKYSFHDFSSLSELTKMTSKLSPLGPSLIFLYHVASWGVKALQTNGRTTQVSLLNASTAFTKIAESTANH